MKPGDFLQWRYRHNDNIVAPDECLWSTVEEKFVHIGSAVNMLLAVDDEFIIFLNGNGRFVVRRTDHLAGTITVAGDDVFHVRFVII